MANKLVVGLEATFCYDLPAAIEKLYEDRMTVLIAPLFHPRFKRDEHQVSDARDGPLTRSDLVLDSRGWTSSIVGNLSRWIQLDSPSEQIRLAAEKVFKQEVAWATHLSVPAVLCPTPDFKECFNYARVLNQVALQAQYLQFWVRLPVCSASPVPAPAMGEVDLDVETSSIRSWQTWSTLHSLCEYNNKIAIALELTADLPTHEELRRWLGEPIRAVILPTNIFLTNRKGYPTLSQRHQKFCLELFQFTTIQFFIKGRPRHRASLLPYVQYLQYLYSKRKDMDAKSLFEAPYLDYLQAPLQPLMDNLESQTYETFEQDACKYDHYELAVTKALMATPVDKESVVMVVGAGRGPIVRCALRAAATANRRVRMYAVEKNPNAVITLRNLKASERWDNVQIISSDMRTWNATEKADIMVSELLGSFSDNELSPECLDGAQRFLKENGLSIPQRYTSYVAPVTSAKLWQDVKSQESRKAFETPYVVRLHNYYPIAGSQACFEFTHPNWSSRIDNRRYAKITFVASEAAVIHGFAGYFDTVLYEDVKLSINPATHSEGMFSWFPIFFPLREPLHVAQHERIHVYFWRMVTSHKVWYEWTVSLGDNQEMAPIHNPNGRSYWIGL